jgi:endonuclease YncB( thermonuclease family)
LTGTCAAAERGEVVRVIDGDTLEVALPEGNRTVRLIGVDTPELGRKRTTVEFFAKEASAHTADLVLGRVVTLERDPTGDTLDRYGRDLRYVRLPDGTLLNAEIIAGGYGHAYTRYPFSRIDEFRSLEREARAHGRGLWDPDSLPTLSAAQAADHLGQTARVCGTVASARYVERTGGQPTFLNLDRPHPDQSLTVVIWGADRDEFGRPEEQYAGERICVTGKIRSYRGKTEIAARHPSQIEVDGGS